MPPVHTADSSLCELALSRHLAQAGFTPSDAQVAQLTAYIALLRKWNGVMNLVGHDDWREIVNDLVLDSFHLRIFLENTELPPDPLCWDFGAGAGLPGIPLRILWQKGNYYMVEAREKRALFIRTALARVNLPRTHAAQERMEAFIKKSAPADLLISRAFMPWEKLLEHMRGKLAENGLALVMARRPCPGTPARIEESWKLLTEQGYALPGTGTQKQRYFYLFRMNATGAF